MLRVGLGSRVRVPGSGLRAADVSARSHSTTLTVLPA